jgi:hypothetical protein
MTEGKRVSVKAVLLGVLVDAGCDVTFCSVVLIAVLSALSASGVPADQLTDDPIQLAVNILVLVLDFGTTVLGGYVAGRVAKGAEVLHGGIVGAISLPVGLVSLLAWPNYPVSVEIVGLVGCVPAGMTGGFLARRRRESKRELSNSAFGRK